VVVLFVRQLISHRRVAKELPLLAPLQLALPSFADKQGVKGSDPVLPAAWGQGADDSRRSGSDPAVAADGDNENRRSCAPSPA
jgi:hypothetical protein